MAPANEGILRSEVSGGIGWLIFDNQQKRNAINRAMLEALPGVLDGFANDDRVRVVVTRGAGDTAFTAGADISELGDRPVEVRSDSYDEGFGVALLRDFPKPTIAMIHGFCMGGGIILAMTADLRIAADDAVFAIPAARIGVAYPLAAIERLTQLVGPAHASDLLFTARRIDAAHAARIGLVNRVEAKAELRDAVIDTARLIAENAPLTVRSAKIGVRQALLAPSERDRGAWDASMQACMQSSDFIEGRRAFAERRPPRFTGR